MLKKMMLLAVMALSAMAFAIPAVASADEWADNGTALEPGEEIEQAYEGKLTFNAGAAGTFSCQVTARVKTNGPTEATIESFSPTTSSCEGTVAFKGCELTADTSNAPWDLSNAATPLIASKTGADITIHNTYKAGSCAGGQTTSHLEFPSVSIAVEGTNPITKLTISGVATQGPVASGSLTPETPVTLGIK